MYKIALIVPYFGKFRDYYKFWLQSCINNPSVDFLIFTDDDDFINYVSKLPDQGGIHLFKTTLEKLKAGFERRLKTKISLNKAYKLCDYKPMYGFLFDEYLRGYDFWGHCDTDLIFGNIRSIITDSILSNYDRIFSRGHLSLYRNIKEVNSYFMKSDLFDESPSWKEVVTTEKIFAFDEWGGVSRIWRTCDNDRFFDKILFDDIYVKKKEFISSQKKTFLDKGKSHFMFEYDNGKLYRWFLKDKTGKIGKESTLYAHFQKRKMQIKTYDLNRYLVVPNMFIKDHTVTKKDVLYYGRRHLFYWSDYKRRVKKLIQIIKGL